MKKLISYNLDMIISVGYRVNSKRATQFCQWTTQVLREFSIKGFVLNDECLKNWISRLILPINCDGIFVMIAEQGS